MIWYDIIQLYVWYPLLYVYIYICPRLECTVTMYVFCCCVFVLLLIFLKSAPLMVSWNSSTCMVRNATACKCMAGGWTQRRKDVLIANKILEQCSKAVSFNDEFGAHSTQYIGDEHIPWAGNRSQGGDRMLLEGDYLHIEAGCPAMFPRVPP